MPRPVPRPGAGPPSPPAPPAIAALFDGLDNEWRRTTRNPKAANLLTAWTAVEAGLTGCVTVQDVLARVRWQGYQPAPDSQAVLSALLRLSGTDALAARALLQALLPRVRAERVAVARFGHGLGEHGQAPSDTMADLVAECFAAIKRHAGEDRPDVSRLVLQEATRKLRTARQAQRRYQERNGPRAEGTGPAAELWSARTSAEWLARSLCQAVQAGHLSRSDARLVYATRVKGVPASEVGRAAGLAPKAVYYALARAEQALMAGAA